MVKAASRLSWFQGFITAQAQLIGMINGSDITAGTDGPALWAWTLNYCRENPLDNLTEAAMALTVELMDRTGVP